MAAHTGFRVEEAGWATSSGVGGLRGRFRAHPAVHDGRQPVGVAGRDTRVVLEGGVKAVGLHVGLVHHIEPLLCTELVPALLRRQGSGGKGDVGFD